MDVFVEKVMVCVLLGELSAIQEARPKRSEARRSSREKKTMTQGETYTLSAD